jgi:hypothetical protein
MTKAIPATVLGLVLCGVMWDVASAEETVQPVRFSIGVAAHATDNRDASDGNEQDNVDVYVRPKLTIVHESEATSLQFYYMPSYRFRTEPGDTEDESSWQHDLDLRSSFSVSERVRLRVYEMFRVQDDPAIEDGGTRVRGDQSHIRNVFETGVNFDLMQYSNLDFLIRSMIKRYDDDDIAATSDEDALTGQLEHRHQLTRTLRSLASGSMALYSYESTATLDRDFTVATGTLGLENAFTANTIGSLVAGVQARDYAADNLDAEESPYVRLAIESLIGEAFSLGGSLGSGVRDSDVYPYVSQEYNELRAFGDLQFGARVGLRMSATYRVSSYDADNIAGTAADYTIAIQDGDETTIVWDTELRVSPCSMVSLFTGVRLEDIDSDVGQSYSKFTGRFGTSLNF